MDEDQIFQTLVDILQVKYLDIKLIIGVAFVFSYLELFWNFVSLMEFVFYLTLKEGNHWSPKITTMFRY